MERSKSGIGKGSGKSRQACVGGKRSSKLEVVREKKVKRIKERKEGRRRGGLDYSNATR